MCLYLLSSYCAQLKSYMLGELPILLSAFLRVKGALKLIRMELCDSISASEKQHTLLHAYTHIHTYFRPFSVVTMVLLSRACHGSLPQSAAGWWSGTDTESLASVSPMMPFASMCKGLFPICQRSPGMRQGWRGPASPLPVLCKHTCASLLSDSLCKTRADLKKKKTKKNKRPYRHAVLCSHCG